MLAWRYADPDARRRIEAALTPQGMRLRLRETRALLLAPGSGALAEVVAKDPLRLAQLAFERPGIGGGMRTQADGAFSNDDGTMRLVLVQAARAVAPRRRRQGVRRRRGRGDRAARAASTPA